MEKLGALALSSDILEKANIGLWAFELDEGCAPRMYADDTMLKLIGLKERISPEETYHAWYDYIDAAHLRRGRRSGRQDDRGRLRRGAVSLA